MTSATSLDALREAAADATATYFGEQCLSMPHADRNVALRLLDLAAQRGGAAAPEEKRAAQDMLRGAGPACEVALRLDPEAEMLAAWCRDFLPEQPSLRLCIFAQTGRGLAARPSGLAADEVALRVPARLVLTSERVRTHPAIGPTLARCGGDVHDDVLLALALLVEESEAWVRYRAMLPARPPCALLWTAAQLQRMGATPLPEQVEAVRTALVEAHSSLLPELTAALPGVDLCWERFLWAYTIVESRGLVLQLDPAHEVRTCLVPVVDMCNHSPSAALAWPKVSGGGSLGSADATTLRAGSAGGEASLEFRTLRALAADEEVCLYYGRLPCLQTLQYYGFLDAALLAHEVIQLDLDYPDEEVEEEAAEAEQVAEAQRALRVALLQAHGLCASPHYLRDHGELSPRLLRALRLLLMNGAELRALERLDASAQAAALGAFLESVSGGLRTIAEGLAEGLAAAAASTAGDEAEAPVADDQADPAIDAAIGAYLSFQQRVLWHTLSVADALEDGREEECEDGGEEGGEAEPGLARRKRRTREDDAWSENSYDSAQDDRPWH